MTQAARIREVLLYIYHMGQAGPFFQYWKDVGGYRDSSPRYWRSGLSIAEVINERIQWHRETHNRVDIQLQAQPSKKTLKMHLVGLKVIGNVY